MSGIQLSSLEASDMFDAIHYMFEEDLNFSSNEVSVRRTDYRNKIYEEYYKTKYKYGAREPEVRLSGGLSGNVYINDEEDEDSLLDIQPFSPREQPTKAYIPPTQFQEDSENPFGLDLDAPLK